MDIYAQWLERVLNIHSVTIIRFIETVSVIAVLWVLYRALITLSFVFKNQEARFRWKKAIEYLFFVTGIVLIGRIWFEEVQSLATFLGLLTAGLAIALKDPVTNMAGWIFIIWRRPFDVGDRIQVGDFSGDVVDIRVFHFSLAEIGNWVHADQSTGRVLHVPNSKVFIDPIANFTQGFAYIWNEIEITISFESDWEKAKSILQHIVNRYYDKQFPATEKAAKKASQLYLLKTGKLTPIVYTSIQEHGVMLTIRYLCKPRERRGTAQAIYEEVLRRFSKEKQIEFAYPTQRFFSRASEPRSMPAPKTDENL